MKIVDPREASYRVSSAELHNLRIVWGLFADCNSKRSNYAFDASVPFSQQWLLTMPAKCSLTACEVEWVLLSNRSKSELSPPR